MTLSARAAPAPVAFYLAIVGLIALAIGVTAAILTGTFAHAEGVRYFGMLMGALMIVAGNALPRLLHPDSTKAAALRGAERLAGWLFVLGGLAVIALWIWAPTADRDLMASAVGLAIFATVLLSALLMTGGMPSAPAGSPEMRRAATSRRVLFHILHAVMWVFGIFLLDALGDKAVKLWLLVAFSVSLGILDVWLAAPLRRSARHAD